MSLTDAKTFDFSTIDPEPLRRFFLDVNAFPVFVAINGLVLVFRAGVNLVAGKRGNLYYVCLAFV